MALVVDYRDHGCSGTFDYSTEEPLQLLAFVLIVAAIVVGFLSVTLEPALLVFIVIGLALLGSVLTDLSARRSSAASFRVSAGWLELTKDKQVTRVFLPKARVEPRKLQIRVSSLTANVEILLEGAPGDEGVVELLAQALAQAGAHDTGSPSEVPEAIQKITRPPEGAYTADRGKEGP